MEKRRNRVLTAAWIVTLAGFLSNVIYFFWQFAGQQILPWLNIALFVAALALCLMALRRAFGQPEVYVGKVSGSIVTVIACLLFAFTIFAFHVARQLPEAGQAPHEGQKAPEFTLADTGGKPVSLASLMTEPLAGSPGPGGKPKAVLLIFYRGYW
jgi:hypothetical protein